MLRKLCFVSVFIVISGCATAPTGPPRYRVNLSNPVRTYVEIPDIPVSADFTIEDGSEMADLIATAISESKLLTAGFAVYKTAKFLASIGSDDQSFLVFSPERPNVKVQVSSYQTKDGKTKTTKTYSMDNTPGQFIFSLEDIKYRNYYYLDVQQSSPGPDVVYQSYSASGFEGEKATFKLWEFSVHRSGLFLPDYKLNSAKELGQFSYENPGQNIDVCPVFHLDLVNGPQIEILNKENLNPNRSRTFKGNYENMQIEDMEYLLNTGLLNNADIEKFAKY
jgi:hypothetical protein